MTGTTTDDLNMRTGPGTSNPVVLVIPAGAIVTLLAAPSNGWYPVAYGGKTGWSAGDWIDPEPMTAAKARDALLTYLRIPYKWGGQSRDGLDCSGLVGEWWKEIGFRGKSFDTTADRLYDGYRLGTLPGKRLTTGQFGALAFYGSGTYAGHVVVGYDGIVAVGADYGGKSVTTKTIAYSRGAMVQLARYDYRDDLLGIWLPDYGWS